MISVIVPVYRSEKTLQRCVESLLNQTEQDFEILLIVDGPPDNSGVLCKELQKTDSRIRVIEQDNSGVSRARNRGIAEARGEYIRFVDSDDYVDSDSNAVLLEAMKRTGADLVVAGYHHLYFGRDILKKPETHCFALKALSGDDEKSVLELYKKGFLNMPWNKLYKKELMKDGFPTDLNLGEDLLFNEAYMLRCDRIVTVDAPVCNYIQDDRGTTLSTKKRLDKIPIALRLYEETSRFFEKLSVEDRDIPVTKVVMEFLDDLEGLAYDKDASKADKIKSIHIYEEALQKLDVRDKTISLELLDYKVIYWFYKRNCTTMVYFLIGFRGFLVKVLKKRG
ncbi:MAG: glycosyltransferase family 2 protein [Lachnospiraceae bacterium]|nr:glycosyltransferase [Lachnospiraceae bacterium]MDD5853202.1 glycosyltransferase family 2 protein [Lachnospiraceae bacterium]